MNKVFKLVTLFVFFLFSVLVCFNTSSALGGLDTTANGAGYQEKDLLKIGGNAINMVLSFVGVLFLLVMMIGGFIWMTAAGNEARAKTAINLLVAGIIGLIVVVSAYAITAWLGDTLKW